ncbi:MAG: D-glycero-beta-D-manno-heptose-7-phosphate kinase [Bacteroidetes bacterium]|nr:D-glycero-beta-D-manno-heptose-7-phosphate kinase [Bacteroidota bacterium]
MVEITPERLIQLKENFKGKKIAVIGDMMLDQYFWGDVKRISPEAPVPVVEVDNEFSRFGGAANVALNILKLGGIPVPIGIIGNDNDGNTFKSLMLSAGIDSSGIIIDNERPTTSKLRVIAGKQHVVRIDKENKEYINEDVENKIIDFLNSQLDTLNGIILEDYNKGVLTKRIINTSIELANKNNIIITVDPKFENFFEYKNVTVFKPNRKEAQDAFGKRITNEDELLSVGKKLLEKLNPKYALLTLGEKGMTLFEKGKEMISVPTKARRVSDVSGAGDTVISTLTIALTAGANIYEAGYLANYAGGLVCEEVGIVPIELDNLFLTVGKEK